MTFAPHWPVNKQNVCAMKTKTSHLRGCEITDETCDNYKNKKKLLQFVSKILKILEKDE